MMKIRILNSDQAYSDTISLVCNDQDPYWRATVLFLNFQTMVKMKKKVLLEFYTVFFYSKLASFPSAPQVHRGRQRYFKT